MSFNLFDTINTLTNGSLESVKAAKDSLGAANDAYHLQMAIKEYGEAKVHQKATELLMEKEKDNKVTYSEASSEVSVRIKATLETTRGEKLFKETREQLNGGEAPEPGFKMAQE
ncbi:hypothetical protein ACE34P_001517 [Vibrio fluvialis]|nr:hypothetical protein [Vibrio fluvialis]HDM8047872.1 hypothetical protein [Vibrio fluvialis]